MRWAKIGAVLIAVIALASVAYFKWDRNRSGQTVSPEVPPHYGTTLVRVPMFRGLQVALPPAFSKRPAQDYKEGQRLYPGPKADGSPSIQLFTGPVGKVRPLDELQGFWRDKYNFSSPARSMKVLEEGRTSVDGLPARWMLVEEIVGERRNLLYQTTFVTSRAEHFLRSHGQDKLYLRGKFRETMDQVRASLGIATK